MVTLLALGLKNRRNVLGERHRLAGRASGDRSGWDHQESTEAQHTHSNSQPYRTLELGIDHDMLLLSDWCTPDNLGLLNPELLF